MDKLRILIVEDETIIAMFTREILMRRGMYHLQVTSSGEQALEIIRRDRPDLVLMDIILSGDLDGIDTMRQIKEIADIPVIFLSAYTDQSTVERASAAGASAFLEKPFRPAALYGVIDALLAGRQAPAGEGR